MNFGALLLVYFLVRAFARSGGAPTRRLVAGDPFRNPGGLVWLSVRWFGGVLLLYATLVVATAPASAGPARYAAPLLGLVGLALVFPAATIHRLAIATGRARFAYEIVLWSSDLGSHHDPNGSAALAAALAALRHKPRKKALAFVEARIAGGERRRDTEPPHIVSERPLLGAGLVAAGIAAAARGDRTRARAILRSTSLFDPRVFPDAAQQIAWAWRAADCATRGDWSELFGWGMLDRHGSLPFAFRLRTVVGAFVAAWRRDAETWRRMGIDPESVPSRVDALRLLLAARKKDLRGEREDRLTALAKRFRKRRKTRGFGQLAGLVGLRICAGPSAVGDRALRLAWALAPRRRATWPLVAIARGTRTPGPDDWRAAVAPALEVEDPWKRGLVAIARASQLRPGIAPRASLAHEAAKAWNEAFAGGAMNARLAERARAVGVPGGDGIASALAEQAIEALVRAVLEGEVPSAAIALQGPVSGPAFHRVRDRLLDDVQALAAALDERKRADRRLPAPDEWAAFTTLLEAHQRAAAIGGENARALAFRIAFPPVTNWAVWLHNKYGQRAIANAVYRWLLGEAYAHGDQHATELSLKNLRAALP